MPDDAPRHYSRREVLRIGMFAGMTAMAPDAPSAAEVRVLPLITRKIPSTGESIPVMGIGTNSFRTENQEELRRVLMRMSELGGSVIDTAAIYGDSESVIGNALADLGIRRKMFVATKFNDEGVIRALAPPANAPAGGAGNMGPPPGEMLFGRASVERSLKRLKVDQFDLLQAHAIASVEPLMPLMREYKQAGTTRYIGITTARVEQHPQLVEYMRKHPVDFVQVDYSLANRDAATSVFPLAAERGIAVMVAVPLGGRRGSLLGKLNGRELPAWAAEMDVTSWSQFLLKYVVSHPAVTCAIPGSSKLQHLEDNQQAGRGRLPDAALRRKMEELWDSLT